MSAGRVTFSSLGLLVSFTTCDAAMLQRATDLYRACLSTSEPNLRSHDLVLEVTRAERTGLFELYADGHLLVSTPLSEEVLDWVAWQVNTRALEQPSAELFLHAAAVAHGDRAVVITGPAGAGKSTLAAALTLAGMEYMGDDSVAVEPGTAMIRSNPKPIAVDDGSCRALLHLSPRHREVEEGRRLLAPAELGRVVAAGNTTHAALVVRASYRSGASTSVCALGAGDAAVLLADQSFNFGALGPAGLRTVAALARRTTAVVIEFGRLEDAVEAVRAALESGRGTGAASAPVATGVPSAPPRTVPAGFDVEMVAGEALVWNRSTCELHHLSPSATAIWAACDGSSDPVDVATSVVSGSDGVPDGIRAEVDRCVRQLVQLGLVPAAGGRS